MNKWIISKKITYYCYLIIKVTCISKDMDFFQETSYNMIFCKKFTIIALLGKQINRC